MHTNSKKTADILPTTNGLVSVRQKGNFITYRDPQKPKARRWGRILGGAAPTEVLIKKAMVERLPDPLPLGVTLGKCKKGAVTRWYLKGTENAINHVLGCAGVAIQ